MLDIARILVLIFYFAAVVFLIYPVLLGVRRFGYPPKSRVYEFGLYIFVYGLLTAHDIPSASAITLLDDTQVKWLAVLKTFISGWILVRVALITLGRVHWERARQMEKQKNKGDG